MSKASEEMSENASKLLDLARKRFGKLNKAEEKLFRFVANGELVDCGAEKEEDNDPANADKWGRERVLDTDRIAWLCTDKRALNLVTHRGIQIKGAHLKGKLDLSYAKISFPLIIEKSAVLMGINLQHAEIFVLDIKGTHTGQIDAYGLRVAHDLYLHNGFEAKGRVYLSGAIIGGTLHCDKGRFINSEGIALCADRMKVEGSVYLRHGFKAKGEVYLRGATIGEALHCDEGQFINENKGGVVLRADKLKVGGNVFMRQGFMAKGEVRLAGATIGGDLDCEKGQFINAKGAALNADRLKVEGDVFLRTGFRTEGEVRLRGATIGGAFRCDNGQFIKPDGVALRADRLKVESGVFLRNDFEAKGEVSLTAAKISGQLDCTNGRFINKGKTALSADGANIEGNVFLRGNLKVEGEVNLTGATIGGNLDCSGGQFINPNGIAILANSLYVKQNAVFRCIHFKVEGEVSLVNAEISGFFYWMCIASTEDLRLDLRSADIGTLRDEEKSWPEKDELLMHGLLYDEIHNKAPRDAKSRIKWLRRQKGFWPQPYEQLAAVLRKGGQGEDVRKILIAKNEEKAGQKTLTRPEKIWYRLLGPRIGYGYQPLRALKGVLFFIVLGWFFFGFGYWGGLISPESDSAYVKEDKEDKGIAIPGDERKLSEVYPRFNFLVYSVDTFVPLINLRQGKYWLPNANRGHEIPKIKGLRTGGLLRFYLWIHILMGWLLSTLLVGGLTRLVRT